MTFSIDPVVALLYLERDNLLYDTIDELSPLRRSPNQHESGNVPIIWDSRMLGDALSQRNKHSPQLIFVARRGARFDGHSLVEDVLSSGNIFVGEPHSVDAYLRSKGCPNEWIVGVMAHPFFIKTRSAEQALWRLIEASSAVHNEEFTSIAITGTNGKTSVTQLAGKLLESIQHKKVLKIGTLGIELGSKRTEGKTPTMPDFPDFMEALVEAKKVDCSHLVFEATSQGLVQLRLGHWLVDVAVFTNLTQDHLDYHKTMEAYRDAKGFLFERHIKHGGTVILNADDAAWTFFSNKGAHAVRNCIGVGSEKNKKKFFTQTQGKYLSSRYLVVNKRESRIDGIEGVWILYSDSTKIAEVNYSSSLVGDFQHDNLAYAAASLVALGYQLTQIAEVATQASHINGRLERVFPANASKENSSSDALPVVLVDYAHSPDALEKALKTCRTVLRKKGNKLYCVFGCGGDRDATKRPIMGKIAEDFSDVVVVTSDNPRTENPELILTGILTGIKKRDQVHTDADRRGAIEWAIEKASAGDLVLIAGKGHEDYQIIGDVKTHFSDFEVAAAALCAKIST